MIFACCGNVDYCTAHSLYKRSIFALGINDNNIRIACKHKICNLALSGKGFTRAGHAENKRVAVEQTLAVCNNHIVADGVLPVVDTMLMRDLLNLKRHKYRKAFGCQCSCSLNLFTPDGKHGVKPVGLLEFQNGKLTQMPSCRRKDCFCICVKLFFAVCHVSHCNGCTHHTLIAGG